MRFLADESCDFAVVTALRRAGHDVTAIAETNASVDDDVVFATARADERVLLTEDKDFGLLAYAVVRETAGVILVRFPAGVLSAMGQAAVDFVTRFGERVAGAFVLEPGRARIARAASDVHQFVWRLQTRPECCESQQRQTIDETPFVVASWIE